MHVIVGDGLTGGVGGGVVMAMMGMLAVLVIQMTWRVNGVQ